MDSREERFKLVAYTRKICSDGAWLDMVTHVYYVKRYRVLGWFSIHSMDLDKIEVRIQG